MEKLSERLAAARKKAGLSQQELADKVGVAQSTIGSLETGSRSTARKIAPIAAALGVNALWLAEGKGPREAGSTLVEMPVPTRPTGRRLQWVTDDEAELLSEFRARAQPEQKTLLIVLKSLPRAIPDDRSDQGQPG
jgi:transcriptional regulator with XRE-family HTH domain